MEGSPPAHGLAGCFCPGTAAKWPWVEAGRLPAPPLECHCSGSSCSFAPVARLWHRSLPKAARCLSRPCHRCLAIAGTPRTKAFIPLLLDGESPAHPKTLPFRKESKAQDTSLASEARCWAFQQHHTACVSLLSARPPPAE